MKGVGEKLDDFNVVGVKPLFQTHEENGESAFETIDEKSFPNKWKILYFYPKDFTFICPTEIVEYANLNQDFFGYYIYKNTPKGSTLLNLYLDN